MLLENASTVQSLSDTEKHNSGGVGTGLVRSPSSKETGESERLWDALGMMTDNVQKHLSENTMSVGNLSYLPHLGEHLGVMNSQAFADKLYTN